MQPNGAASSETAEIITSRPVRGPFEQGSPSGGTSSRWDGDACHHLTALTDTGATIAGAATNVAGTASGVATKAAGAISSRSRRKPAEPGPSEGEVIELEPSIELESSIEPAEGELS